MLAGVSAGAICWCAAGVSDSRSFTSTDGSWPYIAVRGLGMVDVLLAPHLGLGLDDCTALEVVGDRYRILSCRGAGQPPVSPSESAYRAHVELTPLSSSTAPRTSPIE